MKVIGKIDNLTAAYEIAAAIDYGDIVKSSYTVGRREKWYRHGAIVGTGKIFKCEEPDEKLIKIGDRYLAGWHSLLACSGATSIGRHRDSGEFEGETLMLNLGEADFYYENETYRLTDGMVVKFNSKILHGSRQLSDQRYHFTWRRLKNQQLSLF